MKKITNKSAIRRDNLAGMLAAIHYAGSISRVQLGDLLGLSKTAVADFVTELENSGLIVRSGHEASGNAGRPSQIVEPSRENLAFVVNPETDGITLGLCNFAAEIIDKKYLPMESSYSVETLTSISAEYVQNLTDPTRNRLRGAAIAVPGAVDGKTMRLINAPSLNWIDVDLCQIMEAKLNLRTWVRNNARSGTVAEHLFGSAKGCENFVYLFSGVGGIGGGFVVKNNVLEGGEGLAGEIGRMRLLSQGSRNHLTFGQVMNRQEFVSALGKKRLSDSQLDFLIRRNQSSEIQKLIDQHVAVLLAVLETLADLFDPEKIILGGYLGTLAKCRKEFLMKTLNKVSFKSRGYDFIVPRATEQLRMVLTGAAELVWERFLTNPIQAREGVRNVA